jgi:ribose 5-phosphate isomerase B
MKNKVFIASDHCGYKLKQSLLDKYNLIDLGTYSSNISVDYNDFAEELVKNIVAKDNMGILICKTGIGMSIAANRHSGIRAALCSNVETAELSRLHNNANVLVLSGEIDMPFEIVETFLNTPFSQEERHIRRIKKLG